MHNYTNEVTWMTITARLCTVYYENHVARPFHVLTANPAGGNSANFTYMTAHPIINQATKS